MAEDEWKLVDFKYAWVCSECLKDNASDCDTCQCGAARTNIPTEDARFFMQALEQARRLI